MLPSRFRTSHRTRQGPAAAWSLWIAIPLDVTGLYLILAGLHLIPQAWPASHTSSWMLLTGALGLFALARAVALISLRRLLRWRTAGDSWSKISSHHSQTQ